MYWKLYPITRVKLLPLAVAPPTVIFALGRLRQYWKAYPRIVQRFLPRPIAPASLVPALGKIRQSRLYYPMPTRWRYLPLAISPAPFIQGLGKIRLFRQYYPKARPPFVPLPAQVVPALAKLRQVRTYYPIVSRWRFLPLPISSSQPIAVVRRIPFRFTYPFPRARLVVLPPQLVAALGKIRQTRQYYPGRPARLLALPIAPGSPIPALRGVTRTVRQYYPQMRARFVPMPTSNSLVLPGPKRLFFVRQNYSFWRARLLPLPQAPASLIFALGRLRQARLSYPWKMFRILPCPVAPAAVVPASHFRVYARSVPQAPRRSLVIMQTTVAIPLPIRGRPMPIRVPYLLRRPISGNLLQSIVQWQTVMVMSQRVVR